jgi:malonate transporter and related proteins
MSSAPIKKLPASPRVSLSGISVANRSSEKVNVAFSNFGPAAAMESLNLIGGTTSGVSLFALGLIMSQDKISISKPVLLNVFNKTLVHPLIMFGSVIAFGITGALAKEAILLCALPPAIMTTMFAAKYDVLRLESSSSTVVGTVVALLSRCT